MCEFDLLLTIVKSFMPDAVIHFAGFKSVEDSMLYPLKYYENNILSSINLLKAMEINSINNLVFSSSATVYGDPKYLPYDEKHPLNPTNSYGRTKLVIENIIRDWSSRSINRKCIALRYFNPIGAHESAEIGDNPLEVPKNIMPYITQVAIKKRDFLSIFGNDYNTRDGTCERDYIDVVELAEAHLVAVEKFSELSNYQAINIGSGKGITVLELVEAFEKASNISIPYKFTNRREGDLPSFYADTATAKKILNWTARNNIIDTCARAWAWQCKNPNGIV